MAKQTGGHQIRGRSRRPDFQIVDGTPFAPRGAQGNDGECCTVDYSLKGRGSLDLLQSHYSEDIQPWLLPYYSVHSADNRSLC